jgi:hypothetical protein
MQTHRQFGHDRSPALDPVQVPGYALATSRNCQSLDALR